jgi:ribosomal protein L12E/L44/L45/RPP1/RPP2
MGDALDDFMANGGEAAVAGAATGAAAAAATGGDAAHRARVLDELEDGCWVRHRRRGGG